MIVPNDWQGCRIVRNAFWGLESIAINTLRNMNRWDKLENVGHNLQCIWNSEPDGRGEHEGQGSIWAKGKVVN